jgi:hypothetical protein
MGNIDKAIAQMRGGMGVRLPPTGTLGGGDPRVPTSTPVPYDVQTGTPPGPGARPWEPLPSGVNINTMEPWGVSGSPEIQPMPMAAGVSGRPDIQPMPMPMSHGPQDLGGVTYHDGQAGIVGRGGNFQALGQHALANLPPQAAGMFHGHSHSGPIKDPRVRAQEIRGRLGALMQAHLGGQSLGGQSLGPSGPSFADEIRSAMPMPGMAHLPQPSPDLGYSIEASGPTPMSAPISAGAIGGGYQKRGKPAHSGKD